MDLFIGAFRKVTAYLNNPTAEPGANRQRLGTKQTLCACIGAIQIDQELVMNTHSEAAYNALDQAMRALLEAMDEQRMAVKMETDSDESVYRAETDRMAGVLEVSEQLQKLLIKFRD
jgi:hypothetical protein